MSDRNKLEVVRELVSAGVDPNRPAAVSGDTSLHIAAKDGHLDVLQELLNHGALCPLCPCPMLSLLSL